MAEGEGGALGRVLLRFWGRKGNGINGGEEVRDGREGRGIFLYGFLYKKEFYDIFEVRSIFRFIMLFQYYFGKKIIVSLFFLWNFFLSKIMCNVLIRMKKKIFLLFFLNQKLRVLKRVCEPNSE